MYIYDIRVQILSTDYSKCFVASSNLLEIFNTNNNQNISEEKIINFTNHYLIPANVVLKENFVLSEIR
jgi:hypothetical protein